MAGRRYTLKILILHTVAFLTLGLQNPTFQLKREDVRKTMGQMLNYHVEHKEFSSLLARRSLKLYIEQFDPDRTYLLISEAKPYLEPKEDKIQSIMQKYDQDDLSEYVQLNQTIQD